MSSKIKVVKLKGKRETSDKNKTDQMELLKRQDEESNKNNPMESLLSMSQFDTPAKKVVNKCPKAKDIQIDMDKDSHEEIIRKLILTVNNLKTELNEYKIYADGTFCTNSVHNRNTEDIDKRITDLTSRVEDLS